MGGGGNLSDFYLLVTFTFRSIALVGCLGGPDGSKPYPITAWASVFFLFMVERSKAKNGKAGKVKGIWWGRWKGMVNGKQQER